ncbi:LOW QUALITY PROTEIN: uncharacterized protein Dere_GG10335 [Drosophila erecta]|nr:LOW QUALITY PROTEIN: uncharacterized protein Dere_GG10335 [Drosophila erecta]
MMMWIAQNTQVHLVTLKDPPKTIRFSFLETKFGQIMMGVSDQITGDLKAQVAITVLHFVDKNILSTYNEVRKRWPKSELWKDDDGVKLVADKLFGGDKENSDAVTIAIFGTDFQLSVWRALVDMKMGETCTYSPVARNEVAVLIPCHRIVSQNGASKYHWGTALKQQLLAYEKSENH